MQNKSKSKSKSKSKKLNLAQLKKTKGGKGVCVGGTTESNEKYLRQYGGTGHAL